MDEIHDLKIALAFSGGGFRASAFSLGVLTYLDIVKILDNTLLEKVSVLSTVSGGTIAGARYAIGIKNGESLEEIYKSLHKFMSSDDLIDKGLERLISTEGWEGNRVKSLINAFSDIYDYELFDQAKFGTLISEDIPIHLKHISFNATEFANAMQFRFQISEKIKNPNKGEPEKGIIGNYYYRIPEEIAKEIRMSDILAASSCFPGGFEPINFPDDFKLNNSDILKQSANKSCYPVGLMDGGIVDNQGIEPLLLAEERMKRNSKDEETPSNESNVLDLLIISDVTSPYMDDYEANKKKKLNFWRNITPKRIFTINTILLLLFSCALGYSLINSWLELSILFSVFITLNLIVFILASFIKSLPQKFQVPKIFMRPLGRLMKLKLIVYENLIMNRANSLLKMTNEVFLKHVRRLNYNRIYEDKSWKNRRIMNAIYELRHKEDKLTEKINKGTLQMKLVPSAEIQEVSVRATSMSTTLWFTRDELSNQNMLNSIIACGQFTLCWNLLEYIEKLKKNDDNITKNHDILIACEEQLNKHWEHFNTDPLWLVDSINEKINN